MDGKDFRRLTWGTKSTSLREASERKSEDAEGIPSFLRNLAEGTPVFENASSHAHTTYDQLKKNAELASAEAHRVNTWKGDPAHATHASNIQYHKMSSHSVAADAHLDAARHPDADKVDREAHRVAAGEHRKQADAVAAERYAKKKTESAEDVDEMKLGLSSEPRGFFSANPSKESPPSSKGEKKAKSKLKLTKKSAY